MAISIGRLSGGNTPADGSDPRTFPAIWNATADTLEDGIIPTSLTSPSTGQLLQFDGTNWVNVGQAEAGAIPVFADSSARSSAIPSPTEGMVTYVEDADDLQKYDGSTWAAVGNAGIGSNVVTAVQTAVFSTSSSTYVDVTDLVVTITPSSASSKILLLAQVSLSASGNNSEGMLSLFRGSTNLSVPDSPGDRTPAMASAYNTGTGFLENAGLIFIDSPASASALTYSVKAKGDEITAYVNRSTSDGDTINASRQISTLTAIEVAA